MNCDWWQTEHFAPIAYYSITGTAGIYQFISKFQGWNNDSNNQRAGVTIYKDRDNCLMTYVNNAGQVLSEYIVSNVGAGSSYTKTLASDFRVNPVLFKTIYSQSSGQFEHYTSQDEGSSWSLNKVETKAITNAQRFGCFAKTFTSFDYDVYNNFSYMTIDVSASSGWGRVYDNYFTASDHGLSTDLGNGIVTASGQTFCLECSRRRAADLWVSLSGAPIYYTPITYPSSKTKYVTKLNFLSSSNNSTINHTTGMILYLDATNFYLFDIRNADYLLAVSKVVSNVGTAGIVSGAMANPNTTPLYLGIELTSGSNYVSFMYTNDTSSAWTTIGTASMEFTPGKVGLFAKSYATGADINTIPRVIAKYDFLNQYIYNTDTPAYTCSVLNIGQDHTFNYYRCLSSQFMRGGSSVDTVPFSFAQHILFRTGSN